MYEPCRSVCSFRSNLIRVYTVCHSTKYFTKQMHKKQNLVKKIWNKVFKILGHLPYPGNVRHEAQPSLGHQKMEKRGTNKDKTNPNMKPQVHKELQQRSCRKLLGGLNLKPVSIEWTFHYSPPAPPLFWYSSKSQMYVRSTYWSSISSQWMRSKILHLNW